MKLITPAILIIIIMSTINAGSMDILAQNQYYFELLVDPRIELLAVVQSLTTWPQKGAFSSLDFEYYNDVKKYFGPYKDHPAVRWFEEHLAQGWNYDAPPKAMIHLSNPPNMEVVEPFTEDLKKRGGGEESLKKMVDVLNRFIKDTDFMAFWNEHQVFYKKFISRITNQVPFNEYAKLMMDFYGERKSNFVFIPTPLFHPGGYAGELKTQKGKYIYYFGGPHFLDNGFPVFKSDNMRRLIFHEFGHSFVNPVVYDHAEELNKYDYIFKYMEKSMRNIGYGEWLTVVHEHLVRTAASILLKSAGYPEEAEVNDDDNYWAYGFILIPFFKEKLEFYKKNRDSYKSFREFFPELIKVFDKVRWVTEEGPGPMNFAMNLNLDRCKIVRIYENTPFSKAGAQQGDIILELNGIKFDGNSYGRIRKMWYESKIGDKFSVTLLRDGEEINSVVIVPPGKVSRFEKK